jgi:hypothetical protein
MQMVSRGHRREHLVEIEAGHLPEVLRLGLHEVKTVPVAVFNDSVKVWGDDVRSLKEVYEIRLGGFATL